MVFRRDRMQILFKTQGTFRMTPFLVFANSYVTQSCTVFYTGCVHSGGGQIDRLADWFPIHGQQTTGDQGYCEKWSRKKHCLQSLSRSREHPLKFNVGHHHIIPYCAPPCAWEKGFILWWGCPVCDCDCALPCARGCPVVLQRFVALSIGACIGLAIQVFAEPSRLPKGLPTLPCSKLESIWKWGVNVLMQGMSLWHMWLCGSIITTSSLMWP